MTIETIANIDQAQLGEAQKFFAGECQFIFGATDGNSLPPEDLPEVAFAGRSNVGKSSLINAFTNRKSLARVSHTPGRTKQLNFFTIREQLSFVDFPGYGYAKASKGEIIKWKRLIRSYLTTRSNLKRVYILIDSRHGFKDSDHDFMDTLDDCAIPYQIVLTKLDKAGKGNVEEIKDKIKSGLTNHAACHPEIIATSSSKKIGIDLLKLALYGESKY